MKTLITISTILAAISLSACKESAPATSAEITTPDSTLEMYFSEAEIPDGASISEIRTSVKPGDEISISGLVMGREKVFVEGRASFILGDPKTITPCNEMPGDSCTTPWDACCDSKEVLRNGIASIQIVGEDGRVVSGNIKGTKGLTELSTVTVTGIVAPQSTTDALIVNATKIHVAK